MLLTWHPTPAPAFSGYLSRLVSPYETVRENVAAASQGKLNHSSPPTHSYCEERERIKETQTSAEYVQWKRKLITGQQRKESKSKVGRNLKVTAEEVQKNTRKKVFCSPIVNVTCYLIILRA